MRERENYRRARASIVNRGDLGADRHIGQYALSKGRVRQVRVYAKAIASREYVCERANARERGRLVGCTFWRLLFCGVRTAANTSYFAPRGCVCVGAGLCCCCCSLSVSLTGRGRAKETGLWGRFRGAENAGL